MLSKVRTQRPPFSSKLQGEVRILGGRWRRTPLAIAHNSAIRPTPQRLRETLFNWLRHFAGDHFEHWSFLDACAGSGALGFEAASLGAQHVLCIESNKATVTQLLAIKNRLQAEQIEVRHQNALNLRPQNRAERYNVIFLDPPFAHYDEITWLAWAQTWLADTGLLYLEAPKAFTADYLATLGWSLLRHTQAGAVHGHLLNSSESLSRVSITE